MDTDECPNVYTACIRASHLSKDYTSEFFDQHLFVNRLVVVPVYQLDTLSFTFLFLPKVTFFRAPKCLVAPKITHWLKMLLALIFNRKFVRRNIEQIADQLMA